MLRRKDSAGFVTVQYVAASALVLVVLVLVANLLVQAFTVAVVRDAVDEATRAAAPSGASARTCEESAREMLDGLLAAPVARGVTVRCGEGNGVVTARARVRLRSWLPRVLPEREVLLEAAAVKEP